MAYSKQTWKNLPTEETPISAERLTHMEDGIYNNSTELEKKALLSIYANNAINLGRKADTTNGYNSVAAGANVTASGRASHAEGNMTVASASNSHSEGGSTNATEYASHAEGDETTASGHASHSEGRKTTAQGHASHSEGESTNAVGDYSHAEGLNTIAGSNAQHVQGRYNIKDVSGKYAHIVGGGGSDSDRKNIHTIDWQGNAEFYGEVKDGNGNVLSKKINVPLNWFGNADYGTSGQVLQTNGDGTMEWVEVSLGYDETLALLNAE